MKKILLILITLLTLSSCSIKEFFIKDANKNNELVDYNSILEKMTFNNETVIYDGNLHTIMPSNLPSNYTIIPQATTYYREPGEYQIKYKIYQNV